MGVKRILGLGIVLFLLCGCSGSSNDSPARIALLAPFEGRYGEIGYEALYAARLALMESNFRNVTLLPIDDGGSPEDAVQRAQSLVHDPLVKAVIVLGYNATDSNVQRAFGEMPVIVVGNWLTNPVSENIFVLTTPKIHAMFSYSKPLTLTEMAKMSPPFVGNELLAFESFVQLRSDLTGFIVVSNSSLANPEYITRILANDAFAPAPGLLSTSVYDAVGFLLQTMSTAEGSHQQLIDSLNSSSYNGLNGEITFVQQYWQTSPIRYYVYQDGNLVLTDDIIEQR